MACRRHDPSRGLVRAVHGPAADAPTRWSRWLSRLGAVLLPAVIPLLLTGPAGAADDPSASTSGDMVSGVEGSKAALVRIEVSAIADIAHIDHSTGEVVIARGEYQVPIRSGTGVFTSSDGVIATAGSTLIVTEDQVVVYAANRLFQEQIGTALVGNDGDLSRRAQAVDPYWAPHLQHCYDRVEHCILFFHPQFTVFPYTQQPTSTPADLLRAPDGPTDVGLLRIGSGGGTPTAELAPSGQAVPEKALLAGFTQQPDPALPPSQTAVAVDAGTGALSSDQDVAGVLGAGVTGGPVLDPATGQVAGLAATVDGTPTVVPAQRLQEVLQAAGAPPAGSQFDAVFRQGLDHMISGHSGGPAASSFQESLTYYDSALAAQYLAQTAGAADGMADHPAAATAGAGRPGLGSWEIAGVVVVLLLLGLGLLLRRRRAGRRRERAAAPASPGSPAEVRSAASTDIRRSQPTGGRAAASEAASPSNPAASTEIGRSQPAGGRAAASEAASPSNPAAGVPTRQTPGDGPSSPATGRSPVLPPRDRTRLTPSALLQPPTPTGRPPASFCWHCGAPLRDRAHYCAACGSPVT